MKLNTYYMTPAMYAAIKFKKDTVPLTEKEIISYINSTFRLSVEIHRIILI